MSLKILQFTERRYYLLALWIPALVNALISFYSYPPNPYAPRVESSLPDIIVILLVFIKFGMFVTKEYILWIFLSYFILFRKKLRGIKIWILWMPISLTVLLYLLGLLGFGMALLQYTFLSDFFKGAILFIGGSLLVIPIFMVLLVSSIYVSLMFAIGYLLKKAGCFKELPPEQEIAEQSA